MMTTAAIEFGKELIETIKSKDAQLALSKIQRFQDMMKNPEIGADFVVWITEPVNLTNVHKALAEDLGVPQRLLAIKRMKFTRTTKAMLLVTAMQLAVKKVYSL